MIGTAIVKHVAELQAGDAKDIQVSVSWGGNDEQDDLQGTIVSTFPDGMVIRSIGGTSTMFAPFGSGAVFIIHDP
jgi:hypothetical protein